jgi:hypothetical protein
MKKWPAIAVCVLIATWVLYSVAVGEQVIKPAGETMIPAVGSGVFDTISYQEASGTLTLIFRSGYGYEYYGVPRGCYEGLLYTGRKGEYFNFKIRGQFPCRRIDGGHDAAPEQRPD